MDEEHRQEPQSQNVVTTLKTESSEPRRWRMPLLIALYAVSAVAALFLIWRGAGAGPEPTADRHRLSLLTSQRFLASREPGVAWISIHGPIYGSSSGRAWERGMEQWDRRIQTLAARSDVKAIVLDINSPGGSIGAVQELYRTIQRVREEKKKPVVAMVGDVAASGGYWLAVGSDKIVAHPGSLVGSIGVIFETMNFEKLMMKIGVKTSPIKSGKMKDIGSPTRPMTLAERKLLQVLIDDAYGQFLDVVSEGRKIPIDKLKPLADGRVFSGRQALQLGLVDVLGDNQDALMLAGKLAGISGKPRIVRETESFESVMEMLDTSLSRFLHPEASLLEGLKPMAFGGLEYRWVGF